MSDYWKYHWHPVTEVLPPYGHDVIVFARGQGHVTVGRRTHTDHNGEHWERCDGYGNKSSDRSFKPSHWMALPDEPEEKG